MTYDYDAVLKRVLSRSSAFTTALLGGKAMGAWLNVELPLVQNARVDLVGQTLDGELIHLEIQSTNDAAMPLRMAEYWVRLYRTYRKPPRQIVLYFGEERLRMKAELTAPSVTFSDTLIDIRDLDGDPLLDSEEVGDNMVAVLARLRDPQTAVRLLLSKIAALAAGGTGISND